MKQTMQVSYKNLVIWNLDHYFNMHVSKKKKSKNVHACLHGQCQKVAMDLMGLMHPMVIVCHDCDDTPPAHEHAQHFILVIDACASSVLPYLAYVIDHHSFPIIVNYTK